MISLLVVEMIFITTNGESIFSTLQEKLNHHFKKCEFLKDEITYMGDKLSSNGISPGKIKIDTITALHSSQNIKELRSFLGMITYRGKFILKFATIIDPLRHLLKKGVKWTWRNLHHLLLKTWNA